MGMEKKMNTEGTFMWAVEQMKEGKKVRRKNAHNSGCYIFMGVDDFIYDNGNDDAEFRINDFSATDWEIW